MTTASTQTNSRPPKAAVGVALVLLIGFGLGYRLLAAHVSSPTEPLPLDPGGLERLPLEIEEWTGREVPLEERIIQATDTDAHLNRTYARHGGMEVVGLFLAYGVRARDLAPHRPEICYPGSGWTHRATHPHQLPLPDGSMLPCQIHRFFRTGLDSGEVVVLNYYIVDGEYFADVSELRSRAWLGSGGIRYMAQVQVTCAAGAMVTVEAAMRSAQDFAAETAQAIRSLLPDVSDEQGSEKRHARPVGNNGSNQ